MAKKNGQWATRIVGYGEEAPESLVANPLNWRKHPPFQQDALAGVLESVGVVQNVIVNKRTGHLVDGHLRIALAIAKGQVSIPVTYVDISEEEEQTVLATFDPISAMASTSLKKLEEILRGAKSDDPRVAELLRKVAEKHNISLAGQEESAGGKFLSGEELLKKWPVEKGDIFQVGDHRVMCGDSTKPEDVARLLNGEKIMLLATDPPFGVNFGPAESEGNAFMKKKRWPGKTTTYQDPRAEWSDALGNFGAQVMYVWCAGKFSHRVGMGIELLGYEIIHLCMWLKRAPVPNLGHYLIGCEPCFYAIKKGMGHNWQGSCTESTVWEVGRVDDTDSFDHGAQKHVELMRIPIRNNTAFGETVADAFLGTGTTLVACQELGRRGFGMEIEPKFVAIALERLNRLGLEPKKIESQMEKKQAKSMETV
jgi:hypothetical protein